MGPSPEPSPAARDPREEIERRLVRHASRFDIRPLLSLLRSLGYRREDVLFRSNPENVASRTLVHSLTLERRPYRHAVVTCNLGLLGANGLLPSYFAEAIEHSPDPDRFYDFIGYFDHRLLSAFFAAVHPEHEGGVFQDYVSTRRSLFQMLGIASVSTLHWLFALYFPELRAYAERRAFRSATSSHALRVGMSALDGTCVLGRTYESDAAGFSVILSSEEELHEDGTAWPHVVRDRLRDRVLPLLAVFSLPLTVILHVASHSSWAELSKLGYLGWERLRGDEDSGHSIVVFSGRSHELPG